MRIWIPHPLYQIFPLLCVIIGFLTVLLIHTPSGIIVAFILYAYSFAVLWLRESDEREKN